MGLVYPSVTIIQGHKVLGVHKEGFYSSLNEEVVHANVHICYKLHRTSQLTSAEWLYFYSIPVQHVDIKKAWKNVIKGTL